MVKKTSILKEQQPHHINTTTGGSSGDISISRKNNSMSREPSVAKSSSAYLPSVPIVADEIITDDRDLPLDNEG